jgi:DNA-binding NarL/FixJ family response regulator
VYAGTAATLTNDGLRSCRLATLLRDLGYATRRATCCADPRTAGVELLVADLLALPVPRWRSMKGLRRRLIGASIVIVVPSGSGAEAAAILAAGADSLVAEGDLERALPSSLGAMRCGLVSVPRNILEQHDPGALSKRQRQILTELLVGRTNAEIAARLSLAESTVKGHVSALFTKLSVRSRPEALAAALGPASRVAEGSEVAHAVSPSTERSPSGRPGSRRGR